VASESVYSWFDLVEIARNLAFVKKSGFLGTKEPCGQLKSMLSGWKGALVECRGSGLRKCVLCSRGLDWWKWPVVFPV